jgi:hypothetical protein
MSPLPSPEERRKQLKILGLEPIHRRNGVPSPGHKPVAPTSGYRPGVTVPGYRSAAADERAEQRKEGRRRSKQLPHR